VRDKRSETTIRGRGALLQKLATIGFAAGCCVSVWVYGKGNQEIFALPLAFWVGVHFWPETRPLIPSNQTRPSPKLAQSRGRRRRGIVWAGLVASWAVAVIGLFENAAYSPQPVLNQSAFDTALANAESQYHDGHFAESLALLERMVIPSRLTQVEARRSHDRGLALLRLGRRADAVKSLSQSVQFDPRNIEAACLLSEIALSEGDLRTSRLYFDKASGVDPSDDSVKRLSMRLNQAPTNQTRGRNP
jgi:tetratricopeptide (TPR) repeat protein